MKMKKFMLALMLAALLICSACGLDPAFKQISNAIDVGRIQSEIAVLERAEFGGRRSGTQGGLLAAAYLSRRFEDLGLTPNRFGTFYQGYGGLQGSAIAPQLELLDSHGVVLLTISEGLAYDPHDPFNGHGTHQQPLVLNGVINEFASTRFQGLTFPLSSVAAETAGSGSFAGAVRIVPDDLLLAPDLAPAFAGSLTDLAAEPVLLLSESSAASLLSAAGYDLAELLETLRAGKGFKFESEHQLRLSYHLEYQPVERVNVVGYFPGSVLKANIRRILVVAPYTTAPAAGSGLPGAENASGVAVVLEVIRLWSEQGYLPRDTVVFAFTDLQGGRTLIEAPILGLSEATRGEWLVVEVGNLSPGGVHLGWQASDEPRGKELQRSARLMDIVLAPLADDNWRFFYRSAGDLPAAEAYSGVLISRPSDDEPGLAIALDPQELREAGALLSHYLIQLTSR